jgi:hypothetical protein
LIISALGLFVLFIYSIFFGIPNFEKSKSMKAIDPTEVREIINGVELESGLIAQGDFMLVKKNCTACHSGKLITQNRASREGWKSMIVWMQNTQGLWNLGKNEEAILDYLETFYRPEFISRRKNLENIEWYELIP